MSKQRSKFSRRGRFHTSNFTSVGTFRDYITVSSRCSSSNTRNVLPIICWWFCSTHTYYTRVCSCDTCIYIFAFSYTIAKTSNAWYNNAPVIRIRPIDFRSKSSWRARCANCVKHAVVQWWIWTKNGPENNLAKFVASNDLSQNEF